MKEINGNWVWSFIIAGIFVVIGVIILANLITTSSDTASGNNYTGDVLGVVNNETASNFAVSTLRGVTCSVYNITNSTGDVIAESNYTLPSSCSILMVDGSQWNGSTANATYDYSYLTNTEASDAVNVTLNATGDVPGWFGILIVMIMAGMVVGMIYIFRSRQ